MSERSQRTGGTVVGDRPERPYRLVRRPAPPRRALVDDPLQRSVVAHTDGPLLVVGGPGTGKTTTLVEAVAARAEDGADPQRILVLTFNRKGAVRLREQVEARLAVSAGAQATVEPLVRTFHAYAFGLLRRAAAERGEPAPRLLTGPEQDVLIRELLADGDIEWPLSLRPALRTRAFAGQLRDLLLRAAERGIGAAELTEHGKRLDRADWVCAARFLEEYAQVLALRDVTSRGSVGYDPAELIRAAADLLGEDPARLAVERQRLSYVYVDELADTDPAQIDLLDLVAGRGAALVAFADPDSSTYAFRGAAPEIVRLFPDRFRTAAGQPAPTVTLTRSYRAGATLIEATGRVGRRLRGPAGHRGLVPLPGLTGEVEVRTFRSGAGEAAYVAHRLREANLVHGVPWSRMAVIVRSTARHLARLRRALAQAEIPVATHAEDLPLHAQPAVAALLLLLRCALEPERLDEEAAVALLHSPFGGADPLAERRLRQGLRALALAAGDRRPSGVLLVEALRDPTELAAVERRWAAPAQAVARLMTTARAAAGRPGASAEQVLWAVWRDSGLAGRWLTACLGARADEHRAAAADRDLDAVVALFEAAARFADRLPGAGTEVFVDHVSGLELPGDSLAPVADRGEAVRILTAHAAKGLEWDLVVVAGVQEGTWPDLRLRGSLLGSESLVDLMAGRPVNGRAGAASQTAALLDEERRLFYVAASRARRMLLVTAVASGSTGEVDAEEQPSRFLDELGAADRAVDDERPTARAPTRLPRAMTLPALVAELRTAVTDQTSPAARRRAAAGHLATLARAGVRGAHPDDWWGLCPLSDSGPLDPHPVTPSTVDSALRCGLQWLLRRHGGDPPATAQQGIGNLVHAAAMLAGPGMDQAALAERLNQYVGERFDAIELAARWLTDRERARADHMLAKLVGWLAANPRRVLAVERDFEVELEEGIRLRGRVDRLEIDAEGRLFVVDLKTGSTKPTAAELLTHPQLGAYQVAVEAGAFTEPGEGAERAQSGERVESGGAALVQLGDKGKVAGEQVQPPLRAAPDPGWAGAMVRKAARTMAAATFEAVANSACRACPVRTSCPISGKGRQL